MTTENQSDNGGKTESQLFIEQVIREKEEREQRERERNRRRIVKKALPTLTVLLTGAIIGTYWGKSVLIGALCGATILGITVGIVVLSFNSGVNAGFERKKISTDDIFGTLFLGLFAVLIVGGCLVWGFLPTAKPNVLHLYAAYLLLTMLGWLSGRIKSSRHYKLTPSNIIEKSAVKWIIIIPIAVHGAVVIGALYDGIQLAYFHYLLGLLTIPVGVMGIAWFGLLMLYDFLLTTMMDEKIAGFLFLIFRPIVLVSTVIGTIYFWIKCIQMLF